MVGKQTRKTLMQYLRDKGIPVTEAIELLKKIEQEEKKLNGRKEKAVLSKYDTR